MDFVVIVGRYVENFWHADGLAPFDTGILDVQESWREELSLFCRKNELPWREPEWLNRIRVSD